VFGFRVQGLGFRVLDSGVWVSGSLLDSKIDKVELFVLVLGHRECLGW